MQDLEYTILINKKSNYVLRHGQKSLEEKILNSKLRISGLYFISANEIARKLQSDKSNNDINFLIGGGDGTMNLAADCALKKNLQFGILPLGVKNLMAKDLGLPEDIEKSLEYYAHDTSIKRVDVGMINNVPFLCCASIGLDTPSNNKKAMPLPLPASYKVLNTVLKYMKRINNRRLRLIIDGEAKRMKSAVLIISNNQFGEPGKFGFNNFKRKSLQSGKLAIYSIRPRNLWEKTRFIAHLIGGKWTNDPVVKQWNAQTLSVDTGCTVHTLSLDGDKKSISEPLDFWVQPLALSLIVPKTKVS